MGGQLAAGLLVRGSDQCGCLQSDFVVPRYAMLSRGGGVDLFYYVHYSRLMDIKEALAAFDSLSQDTRLRVFRLLVEYGEAGAPAGALSEALHIPHNTLSFHLSHMSHAGLVVSRREGTVHYLPCQFRVFFRADPLHGRRLLPDRICQHPQ